LIQRVLVWFIHFNPKTKRWFWRKWYNYFAKKSWGLNFRFMNYGYTDDGFNLNLKKSDEKERYPIQLYHHTATQVDITKKDVLEIGSGRGGGSSYVFRYLNPKSVTGLDISSDAVELCRSIYNETELSFVEGDAENICLEPNTFDVVLNVESSHCYGDINMFLSEVERVLKPGGVFLWADFRTQLEMKRFFSQFLNTGLVKIKEKNITPNIIGGLNMLSVFRKEKINKHVPRLFQSVFKSYAGIEGGDVYRAFLEGDLVYKSASFKKTINHRKTK